MRVLLHALEEELSSSAPDQALPLPLKLVVANALQDHIRTRWHEPTMPAEDKQAIREGLMDALFAPAPAAASAGQGARAEPWRTILHGCVQRAWEDDCHAASPCKTFLDRAMTIILRSAASVGSGHTVAANTGDSAGERGQTKGKEKVVHRRSESDADSVRQQSPVDGLLLEEALAVLYNLNKHFQYRYSFFSRRPPLSRARACCVVATTHLTQFQLNTQHGLQFGQARDRRACASRFVEAVHKAHGG